MRKSFHPMEAPALRLTPPAHRLDEFPAGYSLAVCSPASPASASPAIGSVQSSCLAGHPNLANGNPSLVLLSQTKGALQASDSANGAECSPVPVLLFVETRNVFHVLG